MTKPMNFRIGLPSMVGRNTGAFFLLKAIRQVAARWLPPEVLRKPKKGLGVPQATWVTTVLRGRLEEALAKSRSDGWFDAAAIDKLWRAHLAGRADYRRSLWNFVFSFPFQS